MSSKSSPTTMDRRAGKDRRGSKVDRREKQVPVAVDRRRGERRKKTPRRRQIDPTTCERDYTTDEIEFMHALDDYKRSSGRMFPTCSEVLEVVRNLGYVKVASSQAAEAPAAAAGEPSPASTAPAVLGDAVAAAEQSDAMKDAK